MSSMMRLSQHIGMIAVLVVCAASAANAIDSELTRKTLIGIQGVNVVIEEFQPNIQTYTKKYRLQREQVRVDVETMLRNAGIVVLNYDQWLKAPGRPFLYIVVNTHEYERYWYAYDVSVELRQRVKLETDPAITTLAGTWAINLTGNVNVGNLNVLRDNLNDLVKRFIDAYLWANPKKR